MSGACDNVTQNIRLVDQGGTAYTASCNSSTGAYSIPNVGYTVGDTFTLYFVAGSGKRGADVTVSPNGNITGFQLYENRVIVREEQMPAISIANMSVYDSHNDSNIPFTTTIGITQHAHARAQHQAHRLDGDELRTGRQRDLAIGRIRDEL